MDTDKRCKDAPNGHGTLASPVQKHGQSESSMDLRICVGFHGVLVAELGF